MVLNERNLRNISLETGNLGKYNWMWIYQKSGVWQSKWLPGSDWLRGKSLIVANSQKRGNETCMLILSSSQVCCLCSSTAECKTYEIQSRYNAMAGAAYRITINQSDSHLLLLLASYTLNTQGARQQWRGAGTLIGAIHNAPKDFYPFYFPYNPFTPIVTKNCQYVLWITTCKSI